MQTGRNCSRRRLCPGWREFSNSHRRAKGQIRSDAYTVEQVRGGQPITQCYIRPVVNEINNKVNSAIEPISNLDHWGTTLDHWDYPVDGKGDCKIYALYKRKLLQEAGFPRQALLMTVVHDLDNEGHTILTVKTDKGDLVLDNLVDEIRPWNATGYYFLKRQSQQNPNIWVSINQRGGTAKRLSPSS